MDFQSALKFSLSQISRISRASAIQEHAREAQEQVQSARQE